MHFCLRTCLIPLDLDQANPERVVDRSLFMSSLQSLRRSGFPGGKLAYCPIWANGLDRHFLLPSFARRFLPAGAKSVAGSQIPSFGSWGTSPCPTRLFLLKDQRRLSWLLPGHLNLALEPGPSPTILLSAPSPPARNLPPPTSLQLYSLIPLYVIFPTSLCQRL